MSYASTYACIIALTATLFGIHDSQLILEKTQHHGGSDSAERNVEKFINNTTKQQHDVNDTRRNILYQNYSLGLALRAPMEMNYHKKPSTRFDSSNNDAVLAEDKPRIMGNDATQRKQSMQWTTRNNLLNDRQMSASGNIVDPKFDEMRTFFQNNTPLSHNINKRAIRNSSPSCNDYVTRSSNSSSNTTEIMIAALLPDDDRRPFSIKRIQPAMLMAVEEMNPMLARYNHSLVINFRDSKCDIADSINEAINFYVDREVDILFGPCCDYALAPVARQVKYWNLPLITAGGLAAEYGTEKRTRFSQITRVGPNYNTLVYFFREIMRIYNWRHLKLLYNPDGQSDLSSRTCHIAVNDLHYGLLQSYEKFEDISEVLTDLPGRIDFNHAGKLDISYSLQHREIDKVNYFGMILE